MNLIPQGLAAAFSSVTAASIGQAAAVVSGVSAFSQARYQAKVAGNNATIADANAVRANEEAGMLAQQQDQEARNEMGAFMAQGGSSGLSLGIGSMGLQRKSLDDLAARDRGYTVKAGESRAAAFRQQGSDFRADAKSANRSGLFGLLESGIGFAGSLISDAPTVSPEAARRVTGTSRPRMRPA